VYAGTVITRGGAEAVVTAISDATALGGIARSLRDAPSIQSPVQRQLAVLGRRPAIAVSLAAVAVALLNLAAGRGTDLRPRHQAGQRNPMLFAAVGLNVVLAVRAVSWNPMRQLLRAEPLAAHDPIPCLVAACAVALSPGGRRIRGRHCSTRQIRPFILT
jgi:cation transport ATPase